MPTMLVLFTLFWNNWKHLWKWDFHVLQNRSTWDAGNIQTHHLHSIRKSNIFNPPACSLLSTIQPLSLPQNMIQNHTIPPFTNQDIENGIRSIENEIRLRRTQIIEKCLERCRHLSQITGIDVISPTNLMDLFSVIERQRYPLLWREVIKANTTLPTTVSCEQSFSVMKHTIHINMNPRTIISKTINKQHEGARKAFWKETILKLETPRRGTLGLFKQASSHMLMPDVTPPALRAMPSIPREPSRDPGHPKSASVNRDHCEGQRCPTVTVGLLPSCSEKLADRLIDSQHVTLTSIFWLASKFKAFPVTWKWTWYQMNDLLSKNGLRTGVANNGKLFL